MTAIKNLQTATVQIEGADLAYEIAGEGPAVVLLHAGFVDRRMWDEQFVAFAQHYCVVRYDQRGFGNSKTKPGSFSHRHDLAQLLNLLNIEQAHLLGCSMGGQISIDFALEYPEMVTSLVLVSSAMSGYEMQGEMPKPLQELMAAMQANDLERAAELAVQLWIAGPQRTPDQVDRGIRARTHEMSLTALPNFFNEEEALAPLAVERLHEIRVPTLVMVGELDDDSIAKIGEQLATDITGAQKVMIAGAAHLPNMEKPAEFNHKVMEFLQQVAK